MKKLNVLMGVLLVVLVGMAAVRALADAGISDPTISLEQFSPSSGIEMKKQVLDSLESLDTAVEAAIDAADANVAQVDTNVTTTTTSYTPAKIGQILIGGKGTGTNAVWISKGVTTNDWVQVAP